MTKRQRRLQERQARESRIRGHLASLDYSLAGRVADLEWKNFQRMIRAREAQLPEVEPELLAKLELLEAEFAS